MCQWYGTGSIRMTGPWLSISTVCFQGIFLWTRARRGPQLEALNSDCFDPVVPVLAPFPQRTWKSLFHKTNSCDSCLVLMAVFRKTKERKQGRSSCLLSSYYVSSRCNERNRGARIPWNQYWIVTVTKDNSKHLCSIYDVPGTILCVFYVFILLINTIAFCTRYITISIFQRRKLSTKREK